MKSELIYASVGCNRNNGVLDASNDGLVCYAGHNSVCLFHANNPVKLINTIPLHSTTITCLSFVTRNSVRIGIISGSTDKSIKFWLFSSTDLSLSLQSTISLESSIISLSALDTALPNNRLYFVACDSSSYFFLISTDLELRDAQVERKVSLDRRTLITTLSITSWNENIFVAVATTDCKIGIYHVQSESFLVWLSGHENWISSVSFSTCSLSNNLLLATASQDKFIRIWEIQAEKEGMKKEEECNSFLVSNIPHSVSLSALLIGHDDWVYSAKWCNRNNRLAIISCSADRTLILWESCEDVWKPAVHLGMLSGGSSQGIFGALLVDNQIFANEYSGSIFSWKFDLADKEWQSQPALTGHMGPVTDICWFQNNSSSSAQLLPFQQMLLSTSADQTTRLHLECSKIAPGLWHEIARPQIHGYDIKCASFITTSNSLRFVSGADEKCLRVFEGTKMFLHLLNDLTETDELSYSSLMQQLKTIGGSVAALGLSGKAMGNDRDGDNHQSQSYTDTSHFANFSSSSPSPTFKTAIPIESELSNATLWPEIDKLYGHVFEIFSISQSSQTKRIASTSKSFKSEFGNILLWNSVTFRLEQTLPAIHSLTVTKTAFSPGLGHFLLSVSRDRSLALFEWIRGEGEEGEYRFIERICEAHSRIIWDCCWLDENNFITVSRDQSLKVWNYSNQKINLLTHLQLSFGCNSVDSIQLPLKNDSVGQFLIAIGLENGSIEIYRFDLNSLTFKNEIALTNIHGSTVTSLKWNHTSYLLASCSADHSVKITQIQM